MSLTNYIINLDEMAKAISDAFDSTKLLNLGQQRVQGLQLEVDNSKSKSVTWNPVIDIMITGVKFGVNDYRNVGYEDYFDMYVNGELMFENIHLKEMFEYKRYRQPYHIPANSEIEFVFYNNDYMKKFVWFDIEYIDREIEAKNITIICIDKTTGAEIQTVQNLVKPPHTTTINAPVIDGYIAVGTTSQTITIETMSPNNITIYFEYEPVPPPVDPDIDHDYDWKITLRWQGNCETDLDLHGTFNNGTKINYSNKEAGSDFDKAWLDYDYTSHSGTGDREDKPEILTILGEISNKVTISIDGYARTSELTEDVILEIQKWENNSLNTLKNYTIPCNRFYGDSSVDICEIDLTSQSITDKI